MDPSGNMAEVIGKLLDAGEYLYIIKIMIEAGIKKATPLGIGTSIVFTPSKAGETDEDLKNDVEFQKFLSGGGTGDPNKNNKKDKKSIDDILKDATSGRKTKGRTEQYDKSGGYKKALENFDNLGPSDVKDIPNGKVGKLQDGRTVNVRNTSSDGRPTLEIYDGKSSIKIRYSN